MRIYGLAGDGRIVWTDDEEFGTIPLEEIGSHYIEGAQIPGTHVEGPFQVEGEDEPCEEGLLLLHGDGLKSLPIGEESNE